MQRREKIRAAVTLLAAAAIVALGLWLNRPPDPPPPSAATKTKAKEVKREADTVFRRTFPVMGTVASVTFYAPEAEARKAYECVQAAFQEVVGIADLHRETSELSRLNASAATAPFVCSAELWAILTEARKAYQVSDGAFDVSSKPLLDLWGFYRKKVKRPPEPQEIAAVQQCIGLDRVRFDDGKHTVSFTVPGMALDLGGIAKGYALDRAAQRILQKTQVRSGVIDLGGNLFLLPAPPPGQLEYVIEIRDPRHPDRVLEELKLHSSGNCAISSSGDYERFVELAGRRYGHILDPVTGSPLPPGRAATAVAPTGIQADWLSTAACLRGETVMNALRSEWPRIQLYLLFQPAE